MGRERDRPDPQQGPVERLAHDLLLLRERAGRPDYRAMARRAGRSPSTLSTVVSGRALPTLESTLAYVRACGGDPAEQAAWARRWKAAAAELGHPRQTSETPEATLPASPPAALPEPSAEPLSATRRTWRTGPAVGVLLTLGAGLALGASLAASPADDSRPPRAVASRSEVPAAAQPERRSGRLTLLPDQVADLDSTAPDWGVRRSPGNADDDVWFGDEDHAFHGVRNADIAVLPPGSAGSFDECALEQDYGVTLSAQDIRPGRLVCDITSGNLVALLRVTNVQDDAHGLPDEITFQVTVWRTPHRT